MKIAVTGKDGVGKTNLTRESFEYYLKEYFLQQFSAGFSAEDIAYVGDIVIDYMKKVWEQVKE